VVDIVWAVCEITLASYVVYIEIKYDKVLAIQKAPLATSASFGLLSGVLYMVS
jgi:hypothetical protein